MESSLTLPRAKHRHTNPKGKEAGPSQSGHAPSLHNVILPPCRSQSQLLSWLVHRAGPHSLINILLRVAQGSRQSSRQSGERGSTEHRLLAGKEQERGREERERGQREGDGDVLLRDLG